MSILKLFTKQAIDKPAKSVVIFLHGLGSSGEEFEFLPKLLRSQNPKFNQTEFIFPCAPSMPITCNNGFSMPAWFDIHELGASVGKEDVEGFMSTVKKVENLVDDLIVKRKIDPENIVLGGFSQGASISLASSVYLKHKIGGFMIISGFVRTEKTILEYLKKEYQSDYSKIPNHDTPIYQSHGTLDGTIYLALAEQANELMTKTFGYPSVEFKKYPIVHQFPPLEDIYGFLSKVLF